MNGTPPWFTESSIPPALAVIALGVFCYFAGRMHQYFRQGVEREAAFRDGYNIATKSLFALATRARKATEVAAQAEIRRPRPAPIKASAPVGPKHAAAAGKSTLQETKQYTAWDEYKKSA